jgi:hypothetical protein
LIDIFARESNPSGATVTKWILEKSIILTCGINGGTCGAGGGGGGGHLHHNSPDIDVTAKRWVQSNFD